MWTATKNKKYGVVIYNYNGNTKCGLPLEIGETVQILEECGGWFRGYSTRKKSVKGIFPVSVVCLQAFHIINEGLFETVIPVEDPTVREVTCVLREWHSIWKKLFVKHETQLFQRLQKVMRDLIEVRRQLIIGTLTQDQMHERKARITAKIDWGNRYLGLDLVPRVDNEVVEPDSLSPVELYKVHLESAESVTGPLGRGTVRKKDPQAGIVTHHIFICMRDFIYVLGEEVEIHFSLYDAQQAEFISERYLVRFSKHGQSNFVEKLYSHCTIFTDLGSADINRDMYIVVHIIRIGRMLNDSKKSSAQSYRRPYGCAVLNITEVLSEKLDSMLADEREYTMKLHMCNENDFHQLHELIIKKQNNKYNILSGQPNYGLVLCLRMLHGDLTQLCQESPLLFKNVSITRKRGFSDVIMPGDVRNDLYFTLERGDFEKGGKSTGKNIEASIYLLNFDGQLLEKCISIGSGQENVSDYQSLVLYHNNAPRWSDLIKLAIPIEKFDGAHVRIEYRHCSSMPSGGKARDREKKLLGFSCIHLMDSKGTILSNGLHELYVYKCEDRSKLQDPKSYLNLPSGPKEGSTVVTPGSSGALTNQSLTATLSSLGMFPRSARELVYIRTLLCSTKLTQNGDVLSLLKWKDHPDHIQDTLNKVMKLDGEEIVKFLQDILDALFSMFSTSDGNSTTHSGLVFKVLVHIFSLLEGSRYEHFKPVMDTYITAHFAAALVYKGLISCVKHCSDLVRDTEQQESIHKCFLSLEYIFKFIIQSRVLFARATGDPNEEAFRLDLHELFHSFNRMLTLPSDPLPNDNSTSILANQVALVNSLGPLFEQLLKVMTDAEVVRIVKMTLEGLSYTNSGTIVDQSISQLATAKLKCILHLISGPVFKDANSRSELLEIIVTHLQLHLIPNKFEMANCAEIIGEIISFLQHLKDCNHARDHPRLRPVRRNSSATAGQLSHFKENKSQTSIVGINRDVDILVMGLLEMLFDCVKQMDRTSSTAGLIVACLIGLLRLMEEQHYCHLWDKFSDTRIRRDSGRISQQSLADFLLLVFEVFREMVREDVFPPDWMVMRMVDNHVILCALQEFSQPLTSDFLIGNAFNKQLWSSFFMLSVAFLTQPALQMETFSEAKRDKISEKYGDMRVLMGFQILSMWDKLGENKAHFIPAMVGPFLEVTLVPETELRKATLPIFFDMMDSEQRASGSFKQVESELIDKLDILVSENKGDDEYRQLFNTMLLERVRTSDPVWKDNGILFINSITRLLERLLDYRNVMEGEENQDKRMSCTFNLLNFYKNEIDREEMYIRYIYKLCDLHLPAENYTEAAFTLKLHADLLKWTNNALHADQRYPQQPEWKRKESLYLKIIEYFDKGKCWEEGIDLCKELANLYERQLFNYSKLSSILKTQARFFDNILTQLRPEPEYFRVGFYGLSFPLFLRNKVFVYRGLEYERIGAFTQRLQTEFPHAQILMKNTQPDDSIMKSDNQYIQICNVKPIPEPRPEFEAQDVPEKILSYYLVNEVNVFQFDRPIHKGPVDKDNEFKSLWIERTTLKIGSNLPGILRWFEVVQRGIEELTPICHACESVQQMNKELRSLITQYTSDPRRSISPLSMRLQGVIEAAVNGGIAKYQEAFFNPDFALKNPEQADKMARLKSLILEQVQILDGGLSLHGRLAPPDVQPLQRRLVDRFAIMKQSIREASSPNMAARLGNRRATTGDIATSGGHDLEPFHRRPSIVNTPLPPIPSGEILTVTKKLSPEPTGSTRSSSSGSSSIYGHFLPEVSDDEDIYSRPQTEYNDGPASCNMIGSLRGSLPQQILNPPFPSLGRVQPLSVATPPPLPTRPRSVALSSSPQDSKLSTYRTMSVRINTLTHHMEQQGMDDGYASLPSNVRLGPQHAPPPLPPPPLRSCLSPRPPSTPVDTLLGMVTTPSSACESLFSPLSCHTPSHPPPLALPPSLVASNGSQAMSRMSWSEPSYNISADLESSPPPLPPRGSEKKPPNSLVDENKPALPRRLIKKASAPALIISPQDAIVVPLDIEGPASPTNYSIPTSEQSSALPPPLPTKKMSVSSTGQGAESPSTPNCTPTHSPTSSFDSQTNDLNSTENDTFET